MLVNSYKKFFVVPHNDGETVAIGKLLARKSIPHVVTGQAWGASWSGLEEDIKSSIKSKVSKGYAVYGVELQGDAPQGAINIDHHIYDGDDRSNEMSSIEQVAELLGVELTAFDKAVALNDKGYIPAMIEAGVDEETIASVRLLDRSAQGITPEQEKQAEVACEKKEVAGDLVVVRLAHSKTATITDRLFGAYQNLLVVSDDGETNFFGNGEICLALQEKFGGWSGGQLPESGFWGGYASQNEVEVLVKSSL